jgi:hypothetical protein
MQQPGTTRDLTSRNERGFAILTVLACVVAVSVITAAGFAMATTEWQASRAHENDVEVFYLAERGVGELLANWRPSEYNAVPAWVSVTVSDTVEQGIWRADLRRIGENLFIIEAHAQLRAGAGYLESANHPVGVMARTLRIGFVPQAALTTRGTVLIRGDAVVDGHDLDPTGWGASCTTGVNHLPGVKMDTAGSLVREGASHVLDGAPAFEQSSDITDSTFTQFGDQTWQDLVDMATTSQSVGGQTLTNIRPYYTADGTCDTSQWLNWGDPRDTSGACGNYFPAIHLNGNVTINSSGYGQGILMVDGDLTIKGGFEFYGVVIVQGKLITEGNGNKIFGAVMASNAALDVDDLAGSSTIQTSSCAVERAILNNAGFAMPHVLEERHWIDLSAWAS